MENKKKDYNTEYQRQKRGSTRKQERGSTLDNTQKIGFYIKKDLKNKLDEKAKQEKKGYAQVVRELIEKYVNE